MIDRARRAAILLTLSVAAAGVFAQESYPSQPIRWLVPYPPGGGTDNIARQLANVLQASLGQPIVIDNRPGGATNVATELLVRSRPDGYTLMQADNAALLFNEHLFAKLPYKPATDFSYIGAIGRIPMVLVVRNDFPAQTLGQIVDYVRANGDKANYASAGIGSPHHLAMELFKQRAGLKITHIAYKGAAPALQDLVGGQVAMMMADLTTALPFLRSGKLHAIAITQSRRAKTLPSVSTFVELGYPDVNAFAFQGLIGPARLPASVVARLNAELRRALQSPALQSSLAELGLEPSPGTPDEFSGMSRAFSAYWGAVIRAAGVKLD